jgi:hypothetical protein
MKIINLTQGFITWVDDEEYEKLIQFKWFAHDGGSGNMYAQCNIPNYSSHTRQTTIKMHRYILGLTDPKIYSDHIDGNSLNNQKYNLRQCTSSQNQGNRKGGNCNNTSGYKGVYYHTRNRMWVASIRVNPNRIYLGSFTTAKDAAIAYNAAAIRYFGEFAALNNVTENDSTLT